MEISVVLMTYLRPQNLQKQIRAFQSQSVDVNEIIIAHLTSDKTSEFNFPDNLPKVFFHEDPGMKSKFIAGLTADLSSDYIAIFDDDCIPGQKYLENVTNCMQEKEGLYGGLGFRIHNNGLYEHKGGREELERNEDIIEVDFVGQNWFMKREHLPIFFEENPPTDIKSGTDDIFFSYLLKKKGIPSLVAPHPENNEEMWAAKEMLTVGPDVAFCRRYNDHLNDRKEIIEWTRDRMNDPW